MTPTPVSNFRIPPAEKLAWMRAARKRDLTLTAWLREAANVQCKRERVALNAISTKQAKEDN